MALSSYLIYAAFVKSLVRNPTEEEKSAGWTVMIDEDAVKRLFMVLYACRNPTAVSGWTSTIVSERIAELRKLSYMDMQKTVASVVFPLTMRFMPSVALAKQHMNRAQHRLYTCLHAGQSAPPDLPIVGFTVILARNEAVVEGVMDDDAADNGGSKISLEAPTQAEVEALCADGNHVEKVIPIIARENTTLTELFGNEIPMDVLLRNSKARGPRASEKMAALKLKLAPLLALARKKMEAVPVQESTMPQMHAVVVAFKAFKGGSSRDLSGVQRSMKGLTNATTVFSTLVSSREG